MNIWPLNNIDESQNSDAKWNNYKLPPPKDYALHDSIYIKVQKNANSSIVT